MISFSGVQRRLRLSAVAAKHPLIDARSAEARGDARGTWNGDNIVWGTAGIF